ncbi:hypothetical protein TNCV_276211 [Trichonephila clavipes]|nr:hypothetical protein TNCV_276211 [Trichonephila clavipes]
MEVKTGITAQKRKYKELVSSQIQHQCVRCSYTSSQLHAKSTKIERKQGGISEWEGEAISKLNRLEDELRNDACL